MTVRIKIARQPRQWVANVLLIAGSLALGLCAGAYLRQTLYQNWADWEFARISQGQPATVRQYLSGKVDEVADAVRAWWGLRSRPETQPAIAPRRFGTPPRLFRDGDLVGRLEIPRLQVRAIVQEGTTDATLAVALGHIAGTAIPGQSGNAGIAGHRDTLFRKLAQIRKNDVIAFQTINGRYLYQVEGAEVVTPQDVGVLQPGQQPEITLVTCYPFHYIGAAPDRFIVKARLVFPVTAALSSTPAPPSPVPPSMPRRQTWPAAHGVAFQVREEHSRQLAPGISLGVSSADVSQQRVNGWLWIMPDRRTIWLRNQPIHEAVVFYGGEDGRRHELILTRVGQHSATGYLREPSSQ